MEFGRRSRHPISTIYETSPLSTHDGVDDPPQPMDVNRVVEEAVRVLRPMWKDEPEARGVAVDVTTALGEVPLIQGSVTGLHEIFTNLILNAVTAMSGGGTIAICTNALGDVVEVTVADTGEGMREEVRSRVFEPFFTTKADVGSGLGLFTVHGTVSRWGGTIEVESLVGKGTTFTLGLPVWTESEQDPVEEDDTVGSGRRGKILIVDDDDKVGRFLRRLLGTRHDVEVVPDGPAALRTFAPGLYDAALIDLGLPGMPGDQLAREVKQMDPTLATALITGWHLSDEDPRRRPFDFRIQKPLNDVSEVERTVDQAVSLHDDRVKGNDEA